MAIDPDFWRGRRVLVTGNKGFKGAWLTLWLGALGAEVAGLSRPAAGAALYERIGAGAGVSEHEVDVRDRAGVAGAFAGARPEVVLHLAGQSLVHRSLRDPVGTYEVNVTGTVNVLEAVRAGLAPVRAVVVVTSERCYENIPGRTRPFSERDPLGGSDPYSSSKACAELVASAYRRSFGPLGGAGRLATARPGNVIGGGDRGDGRLMGDALRAVEELRPLRVRDVDAVRPWQHVLNPLAGYLLLAQELWRSERAERAWNFGPPPGGLRPAGWIAARLAELWEGELEWLPGGSPRPPEDPRPPLDSSAAESQLGWRPPWGLAEALERTVEWHRRERAGEDMRRRSLEQIEAFAAALDV